MVEADDLHASFTDDLWAWTNGLLRATLSGAPIVGGALIAGMVHATLTMVHE